MDGAYRISVYSQVRAVLPVRSPAEFHFLSLHIREMCGRGEAQFLPAGNHVPVVREHIAIGSVHQFHDLLEYGCIHHSGSIFIESSEMSCGLADVHGSRDIQEACCPANGALCQGLRELWIFEGGGHECGILVQGVPFSSENSPVW